jgi:hypothetical protein
MALTRRYEPPHPPTEAAAFGMDFSGIVPEGIGLSAGSLKIFTNTAPPVAADADWTFGTTYIRGRSLFQNLLGGVNGKDYLMQWTATDTRNNVWVRTALILCSATS